VFYAAGENRLRVVRQVLRRDDADGCKDDGQPVRQTFSFSAGELDVALHDRKIVLGQTGEFIRNDYSAYCL